MTFVDDEVRTTLLETTKLNNYDLRKHLNKNNKIDERNLTVNFSDGSIEENVDYVLAAVGRSANIDNLGLENTDIKVNLKGFIIADEFEQTNVEGLYAIGDVSGKLELTLVAIKAGRTLAERLFNNKPDLKWTWKCSYSYLFIHTNRCCRIIRKRSQREIWRGECRRL